MCVMTTVDALPIWALSLLRSGIAGANPHVCVTTRRWLDVTLPGEHRRHLSKCRPRNSVALRCGILHQNQSTAGDTFPHISFSFRRNHYYSTLLPRTELPTTVAPC